MARRHLSIIDNILCEFDTALRTLLVPKHRQSTRDNPGKAYEAPSLTSMEKRHVAGLMRVNHAGEVCAQALYQGQALTAQLKSVKEQMSKAATEEVEHLAWCEQRLFELGSQPSLFNPFWYLGSLTLGAIAGLAGDRWSLGFVAETERQVSKHLQHHIHNLPPHDIKTKAILSKMQEDEAMHAETAIKAGGAELPYLIQKLMRAVSKVMTKTSYYI